MVFHITDRQITVCLPYNKFDSSPWQRYLQRSHDDNSEQPATTIPEITEK